jgi:hypothetical protein
MYPIHGQYVSEKTTNSTAATSVITSPLRMKSLVRSKAVPMLMPTANSAVDWTSSCSVFDTRFYALIGGT